MTEVIPAEEAAKLFQKDFAPEEFAARRGRIFDAIGPEAVALIQGADPPRGFEMFRQTNTMFYCCGLEVPQAYLRMNGADRTSHIYLPARGEGRSAEGAQLASQDAEIIRTRTGADGVHSLDALEGDLAAAAVVFVPHQPAEGIKGSRDELTSANKKVAADPWDARPTREEHLIALLRKRLPGVAVRDLSPILDDLRRIKSPAEIDLMRKAGQLSALALAEALRATAPGVIEYQLGAIADYVYHVHGARGHSYRHIIAGGANMWHAHYCRNSCALRDGDIVLMDTAPDLGYYTSDIGRIWPVNGTYAPWQRELYGYIVQYHRTLLELIRPGLTADEIHSKAAERMAQVVETTRWSKPAHEAAARNTLEFKGHLSHPVGMTVHDVAGYRDRTLQPGMVITVDPQMWVREEKTYIRVEDTIAITEDGIEVLTTGVPLDLDETEALMTEPTKFPGAELFQPRGE